MALCNVTSAGEGTAGHMVVTLLLFPKHWQISAPPQTCCVSMMYFLGDSMCCLTTNGGSGVMTGPSAPDSWELTLGSTAFTSPPCTSAIAHTMPSRGIRVCTSTRYGWNGYGSLDRHHRTSRSLPGAVTSSRFPTHTAFQMRQGRWDGA